MISFHHFFKTVIHPAKYLVIVLFAVTAPFNPSEAQNTAAPASIYAASLVKKNTIVLRWVPSDYKTWKLGNRYGYTIERITSTNNKLDTAAFNTGAVLLTKTPIVPAASTDTIWKYLERESPNSSLFYSDLYTPSTTSSTKKEETTLWGFLMLTANTSAGIAKAAGLYFKDSTINNATVYGYRISLVKNNETKGIKPYVFLANAATFPLSPAPADSVHIKFASRVITLKWNVPLIKAYDSYNIERSADSINFKKVNKSPYVLMSSQYEKNKTAAAYYDSIPKNNVTYYYRIKGVTPFGEEGPPSKIVKGQGSTPFDSYPLIDSAKVIGNKKSVLVWRLPKNFPKNLLKGYSISRSDKDKGTYIIITPSLLAPNRQRFEDATPLPVNYYKILAISIYGDTAASFPAFTQLQDLTPPLPPTALSGKADAKGIVTLSWEPNKETDLMGYRVFRANSPNEEFVEVTRKILVSPAFTDTIAIRTLTKHIYYQLTAVDKVHNNSAYTAPVKIKRPDVVPPVEPVITSVTQSSKGIRVKWIPSSSNDVTQYELVRYNVTGNLPTPLKTWNPADTATTYSDSTVSNNTKYTYIITVTDDSDNKSKKISPMIEYRSGIPPLITDINFSVDRTQNKVTLTWKYTQPNVYHYILYKAKKGEALRIYKTLPTTTSTFEDTDSHMGNTYIYKLKAVFNTGEETPLSKVIEVVY